MNILHVVLVDWAEGTSPDVIEHARAVAAGFPGTIPGVLAVSSGGSVSTEGLEQGYDCAFVLTFADAASLAAYLPDPTHLVLAGLLQAHGERVLVFDLPVSVR